MPKLLTPQMVQLHPNAKGRYVTSDVLFRVEYGIYGVPTL